MKNILEEKQNFLPTFFTVTHLSTIFIFNYNIKLLFITTELAFPYFHLGHHFTNFYAEEIKCLRI